MTRNLDFHIEKSFERLSSDIYSIEKIWQKDDYGWPGDWEGRALLAFVCLYEVTGRKIPCMDKMLEELPAHLNEKGYMGAVLNGVADEQQLSGHSWLLRGLCEYYGVFRSEKSLGFARGIVENLYLPLIGLYEKYPLERNSSDEGGVSGNSGETTDGWKLSTDTGCAYMCLDGLSAYYEITRDDRVETAINRLIDGFMRFDRMKMRCQTHATLSATRGILGMYLATGERDYLEKAVSVYEFYLKHGMTLTYENYNWFGRENTWTEPCAVVDSFVLAVRLYGITKKREYRTLASRIWFNGLSFCHRANGGAGPNACVTKTQPYLSVSMYEAPFCCTMRYCEGLKFAKLFKSELFPRGDSENGIVADAKDIVVDEYGRVFMGDELLVIDENNAFPDAEKHLVNGKEYIGIPAFIGQENVGAKLKVCDAKPKTDLSV